MLSVNKINSTNTNNINFQNHTNFSQKKTRNERVKQKIKNTTNAIVGTFAGLYLNSLINRKLPANYIYKPISERIKNLNSNLSADEITQIKLSHNKILEQNKLKNTGLEIIEVSYQNAEKAYNLINENSDKGFGKLYSKKHIENKSYSKMIQILRGNNATYLHHMNKIIIPKNGLELAIFHEAGHAVNYTTSKLAKPLTKMKYLGILTPLIALTALCKRKKSPNDKPKNKFDKTTDFIKNNVGKLTFASLLPALAEEGLASIRGCNTAKKLLNPDLAKKVTKLNILGFSTYLVDAVSFTTGIFLATKLKDKISKPIQS